MFHLSFTIWGAGGGPEVRREGWIFEMVAFFLQLYFKNFFKWSYVL